MTSSILDLQSGGEHTPLMWFEKKVIFCKPPHREEKSDFTSLRWWWRASLVLHYRILKQFNFFRLLSAFSFPAGEKSRQRGIRMYRLIKELSIGVPRWMQSWSINIPGLALAVKWEIESMHLYSYFLIPNQPNNQTNFLGNAFYISLFTFWPLLSRRTDRHSI